MLKIIELFAGVGSQTQALKNIGVEHEVIGISEIDKYAISSYEQLHGKVHNFGDISKIKTLPQADLWTYSFPCFIEGTLVLTDNGYKKIEEVGCDDSVLTHNNRYKKVIKPMINQADHIYKLSTMCSEDLLVTEEHPFYVRKMKKIWNKEEKKKLRTFGQPIWMPVKDLSSDYYVGIAINQENKLPIWSGSTFKWSDGRKDRESNKLIEKFTDGNFWWIIGRYIGDGWIRSQGGIIICCDFEETVEITSILEKLEFNYNISKERTTNKIHISFKEIGEYCEQFGRGAKNKKLTKDIFNLPISLLKRFIEGYMSADGCLVNNSYQATSVSQELIYGLGQCVSKAFNRPFSIYKTKRPKTCKIENRIVNQNDTYMIRYKLGANKQDKAFFENGYIWCPINDIKKENYEGLVYNIEVDEDNSYVVQNIIVHNCQDLSVSGKLRGLKDGTRSGLLYEVERLLKVSNRPDYLLMENVKNLVGKQFKKDFDLWCETLEGLGYTNYWKVLNAKNFGVPQNRERVFMISIKKEKNHDYIFPEDTEISTRLKDILEYEVEEKYYNNTDKARKLCNDLLSKYNINGRECCDMSLKYAQIRDIANCVMARYDSGITNHQGEGTAVIESIANQKRLGGLFDDEEKRYQAGSIWDKNNISPTLSTMQGGYSPPCIISKVKSKVKSKIIQLGNIVDTGNFENSQRDRIYSTEGISPTLNTVGGGGLEPKIVVEGEVTPNSQGGKVYNPIGLSPTLYAETHGYAQGYLLEEPVICASRGRDPENPSNRETGLNTEQRLEVNKQGISNCLTTVQKDNMVLSDYRIRKLTPRECWRLMGWKDEQFDKIKGISNSQLYKQAGNGIVVNVLEAIFMNLFKK